MRLMRTPKKIDIDITNRCNLRCRYCYHYESAGDAGGDLPTGEWLSFFEELNRCAVTEVCLAGGEAFIRDDLKEIIDGVVRNRMRFMILSNGTLITDDMATYLASTGRCNYVQVSIDGSIPESHDAMRGKGSFDRALQGLLTLRRHRVHVVVRVTIHRKNVHDLENIARLLLDEIGLSGFGTNSAGAMGLCRKNAEMVQLTTEERMIAMETLLRLTKKYNGRIQAMAGPLAEARGWLEMEQARLEGQPSMPNRGALTGCGCYRQGLAVRADGVITPCTMLSQIELGRINRDDLGELWRNHNELNALRQRHHIPLSTFSFCEGCEYINYCTGSCPGLSYTLVGEVNHPSPDACLRNFLAEGGRLPDRALLC
ncbi:MAG TPA: SynChlorMet cassette radical SAM/SPASM protein ScmE [Syntrophales bacterium]|nr:SynChlorMet cassette radical SAM/SPASM protein ScmE [Syntrophales bacterium]HOX93351.1 SynChlorMet cassette radical SAM/SPASM protein ScmE [Syntrophales bacterium]HPI56552.1 SynChlorMet cassette radical SAM/SPASM protein ScmE [Syntrophales bacterium]HPN25027.1 SynChlorMet cassette radical SAM/SPASM protein ScmE [Syntrophales bacterium]HQM29230.1 SynChlorMet cassette radical SAM/SPASM protein ScmE [Syntrophales bacterium]